MGDVDFGALLARADDEALQELVGPAAVRLLTLLDPALAKPSALREVLLGLRTPHDLLTDGKARAHLFDVMPRATAARLVARLGAPEGVDPYAWLRQAALRRGSATYRTVLDFFGVSLPPSQGDPALTPAIGATAARPLFAHQRRAVRETIHHLRTNPRRALLHMPTGAGKTRTAMQVVAQFLRDQEPCVAVWLAYSEELCEQAAEEFLEAWSAGGDRDVKLYRYWGKSDLELDDARDGLLVAGLGKIFGALKADLGLAARLGDRAFLVVIDEAHQALADTYRLVLELLAEKNPQGALLGLTATPGRSWNDVDLDEQLARVFFRRKVSLRMDGYDSAVDFLIQEKYLAQPVFDTISYCREPPWISTELETLAAALDVPTKVLEAIGEDERRNLLIVHKTEELLGRHKRVILFAASVRHARLLATVLRARGTDAMVVDNTTASEERRRILDRYKSDLAEPMVLCNYGVLTAGFDAPQTSTAVIARPTKSLVLYSQMVGRAIRGLRAGGNENAEIVTVVDTSLPGFGDIAEAFRNWEDVWS